MPTRGATSNERSTNSTRSHDALPLDPLGSFDEMMAGPHSEEQPPLGETTPALLARRGDSSYSSSLFVGAVGLLVGVAVGFGAATSLHDHSTEESSPKARPVPPPVVTTAPPARVLPSDCEQALRSAETVVQLLEQGFQSIRRFEVERIEEVLADLGRLRSQVTANVVGCQEQLRR